MFSMKFGALIAVVAIGLCPVNATTENARQGKLFDIMNYFTDRGSGFRLAPVWKQWSAVLTLNVQKHKQPPFLLVPSPYLFHPPGIGGLGGLGGGLQPGRPFLPPFPLPQFDDNKPANETSTSAMYEQKLRTVTPKPNSIDDFINEENSIGDGDGDRVTRKRDIKLSKWSKLSDLVASGEVSAQVIEIPDPNRNVTAPNTITDDSNDTVTPIDGFETETNDNETTVTTTESAATTPDDTDAASTEEIQVINIPVEPIILYYGGQPNANANTIYITTTEASAATDASQSSISNPNSIENDVVDRTDFSEFRPSVQYEYRNYRYDVDNHFIPIVGHKQIF